MQIYNAKRVCTHERMHTHKYKESHCEPCPSILEKPTRFLPLASQNTITMQLCNSGLVNGATTAHDHQDASRTEFSHLQGVKRPLHVTINIGITAKTHLLCFSLPSVCEAWMRYGACVAFRYICIYACVTLNYAFHVCWPSHQDINLTTNKKVKVYLKIETYMLTS